MTLPVYSALLSSKLEFLFLEESLNFHWPARAGMYVCVCTGGVWTTLMVAYSTCRVVWHFSLSIHTFSPGIANQKHECPLRLWQFNTCLEVISIQVYANNTLKTKKGLTQKYVHPTISFDLMLRWKFISFLKGPNYILVCWLFLIIVLKGHLERPNSCPMSK